MTESFSADWLALREPADHAARSADLTVAVAAHLARRAGTRAVDLAAGTGSNVRYLLPRVVSVGHWTLVDHDAALLAQAWRQLSPLAHAAGRSFDVRSGDLVALDTLSLDGCGLVTAAALLDLVSDGWIRALASRCRAAQSAVLFALSYDGRIECEPAEPGDTLVRDLVNAHQRRDKGFGPALGPDASSVAEAAFVAEGYEVRRAKSDWQLGPSMRELQSQLVSGWAQAAREISPSDAPGIAVWSQARVGHIASGRSAMRVGHEDLAAWRDVGSHSADIPRSRA